MEVELFTFLHLLSAYWRPNPSYLHVAIATVNWSDFGQRGYFGRFQNQKITLNLSNILASLRKEDYYDIDLDRPDDILVNFDA